MKKNVESVLHTFRMMLWSWRFIRRWSVPFVIISIVSITQNAWMSITSAYLIGQTTEHAATGNFKAMLGTVGVVSIIALIGIIMITAISYYSSKLHILGLGNLRKALFAKLNAIPVSSAEQYLSGDMSTRMTIDADRAASFFSSMTTGDSSLLSIPVSIIASTIICIYKLPIVGVINLIFLFLSIYINLACIRREYAAHTQRMNIISGLTQRLIDILSGSVIVRIFGITSKKKQEYETGSAAAYTYSILGAKYNAARSSLSSAIQWAAIIFSLVAGGIFANLGVTDLGTVIFIVMMQSQINNDVLLMVNSYHELQYATVSATRIKEILDCKDEDVRQNMAQPDLNADTAVSVSKLMVSYGQNAPVLNNISFHVKNGERLAIVGGSGGGKTTLLKYLLEFIKADSGLMSLYGQSSEQYSQEALRNLISYVPQNCYLFDGTIKENIACGTQNATDEEVENAVSLAGLNEVISSFPKGLNTRVGEYGAQLSGGQRQRIAIARALIKAAPLLLLDEPTSSLDGETEQAIQDVFERMLKGRTSIMIAHRLSTIQNADRIIVVEHGEIIEEGQHEELLTKGGRYSELYRLQFERAV